MSAAHVKLVVASSAIGMAAYRDAVSTPSTGHPQASLINDFQY
jgi:hypothetical protein